MTPLKRSFLCLFAVLAVPAFSNAAPKEKEPTKAELYSLFCGTTNEALDVLTAHGELPKNATKEEIQEAIDEMIEPRTDILEIIAKGAPALKKISDTDGDLAVVLNCSIINKLGSLIIKNGCYDIKNNTVVRNNGGVEVCKSVAESMED